MPFREGVKSKSSSINLILMQGILKYKYIHHMMKLDQDEYNLNHRQLSAISLDHQMYIDLVSTDSHHLLI